MTQEWGRECPASRRAQSIDPRTAAVFSRSVTSAKNASGWAWTEAQPTDGGSVRKDGDYLVPGGNNKDEREL